MTIVIPMAGRGQRFTDAGHLLPKFLLEAHGKTLLQWSVDSLPLELASLTVFILLREHEEKFQVESKIRRLYNSKTPLAFVLLDEITRGQAETILRASSMIKPELPLIIFNIDTMFRSPTLKSNLLRTDVHGVLGSFRSTEPRFSFATTDHDGSVTLVTEKEPVSDNALTGLYHFRRAADFLNIAQLAIDNNLLTLGEFYVAPLYNELLKHDARIILDHTPVHHILGTPEEYEDFLRKTEALRGI